MTEQHKNAFAERPTHFTAGHGLYNFGVSHDTFERSLYYNLLLQNKLAWSDHFFLQGNYVQDHLRLYDDGKSWLEAGLEEEIIIPYFRDTPNFSAMYSHMINKDLHGLSTEGEEIARRLDKSLRVYDLWPTYMVGERYLDILMRYFDEDAPPLLVGLPGDSRGEFERFWKKGKEWNLLRDIHRATERTQLKGGKGIQVSELINVTGERLFGRDIGRIDTVLDLLELMNDKKISGDEREFT